MRIKPFVFSSIDYDFDPQIVYIFAWRRYAGNHEKTIYHHR